MFSKLYEKGRNEIVRFISDCSRGESFIKVKTREKIIFFYYFIISFIIIIFSILTAKKNYYVQKSNRNYLLL